MPADTERLYVGIELPAEVRAALGRLQQELQRRGLERLRWVRPEGIHLTLKFLGQTSADKVPSIRNSLERSATGLAPHDLSLGELGTFGRPNPRVLRID